jgi:putative ABC transport system permease protein
VRDQLATAGRSAGLDVDTVTDAAADVVKVNRSFTDVFAVVLSLALLIVLVSMSAGVVRSGRERRGELGVLRALGMSRRAVVLLLAGEPVLVGVLGVLLGSVVGVGVLRALFAAGYSDLPFLLPLGPLAALGGATAALLALTCGLAAWPAARRSVESALGDLG